ncbi:uncharacterized protein NFIA_076690 [Aspergillus fischeri NRRL 181]|uniref:Uncharacterized protein n=1 Tax=Neosartorya fischeri (strain ATCC 1020 / DSM 3700 / CBS 544.65 / FGSC A1164 / JCM 1740 / NRRL 181 / WB 181) TaxID=331117 RepID=A1DED2_NEOFI|nr:uncharacterized protein NFIA_076690 [Aspergillus fischeri NRRL 181]EAW17739.1 hypothetical protein NFIA_076690 [Aspergillus fischeri NRRL 181]
MGVTKLASITVKTDYSTAIAHNLKSKDFEIVLAAGRSPATTFQMETATTSLKRRIHESNAIALFAAFGLTHNANMTHLAAMDLISLETFHDTGKCALLMNQSMDSISRLCSDTTPCIVS